MKYIKKFFAIILIVTLLCTACSKENKINSIKEDIPIEKNVDALTLLNNLNHYLKYSGEIVDHNKKLVITFHMKQGVIVPKNPPKVEAKVYLWKDNYLVGIYYKPLYNSYKDYLKSVTLTFLADGEIINRFEVSYNAESTDKVDE